MSTAPRTLQPSGMGASWLAACLLVGAALGAGAMYAARGVPGAALGERAEEKKGGDHDKHEPGIVALAEEKQKSAGIEVSPVPRGRFALSKWVTGRLTPNEDRLAHVYSQVEGIVHEVPVRYGQRVKAGDVLAVVDSQQVGKAKLALVGDRQDARIAAVNKDWAQKVYDNTQALIRELEKGDPPQEIAERFRDKPIGENREQLVSAYARLQQTRAENDRSKSLADRGSLSQREYQKAKADFEAAQATYSSLLEQIRFTSGQQLLKAQQALDQARVAEGASRSALVILGYREADVQKMDPLSEGEEVAHYTLKAPFAGTVTGKEVVLNERVGPEKKLFDLADLSTVWVQADIFEKDLPALVGLQGRQVRFRAGTYPGRRFEAKVFYAGDIVEEKTRAVRLTAAAENPDGALKPGMFVEVELPIGADENVIQVPASALQDHEGKTFVFVRLEDGQFRRRDVTVGRTNEQAAEVAEGLKEGDQVVVRGAFALKTELLREQIGED